MSQGWAPSCRNHLVCAARIVGGAGSWRIATTTALAGSAAAAREGNAELLLTPRTDDDGDDGDNDVFANLRERRLHLPCLSWVDGLGRTTAIVAAELASTTC